jgi:hypothetical protein
LLSLVLAMIASALFCWPTWPGFMSFDSLFAYKESLDGIQTAVWPPMQAYVFFLSRSLGGGVAGVFFGQTAVLFFSAGLIFSLFLKRALSVIAAFVAFCALFVYFPTLWGTLAVLWKDVTTTSFALLGIALWLVAMRGVSFAWLIAANLAFAAGIALRYNAFPLTFFVMLAMVAAPFGLVRRPHDRWIAGGLAVMSIVLAIASTVYRLPDFQRLPSATGFTGVQEFDLIGISACSDHNYLPLGMSSGQPITPAQIRQLYDPRHVQLAFQTKEGIPTLVETDAGGNVVRAWKEVLPKELGCYLFHRAAVFTEQMGLAKDAVFYVTHGGIDANPYGIALTRPQVAAVWTGYIVRAANEPWRRPILLYGLAVVVTLAAVAWGSRGKLVLVAMLLGAIAYPATLFFVGPAADARYIFPSNVVCALLIVLGVAALLTRVQRPAAGRGGTQAMYRTG